MSWAKSKYSVSYNEISIEMFVSRLAIVVSHQMVFLCCLHPAQMLLASPITDYEPKCRIVSFTGVQGFSTKVYFISLIIIKTLKRKQDEIGDFRT